MLLMLLSTKFPYHSNRLVALVYLETVTRYVKFTQDNAQCIPIVLAPFLDEKDGSRIFEVIGLLIDTPKKQSDYLSSLLSPFCQQVEAVLRNAKLLSYGESGKSSWQLILSASESLVTASRPAIGNMFKRLHGYSYTIDHQIAESMSVYTERDIAQRFTFGSIAADFESLKERNGSQPCSPVTVYSLVELLGEEESDGSPLLQVAEDMVEDDISARLIQNRIIKAWL
ncbi:ARM repeat superfamily protein [Trifolium repens]|nr:ARM repeat superfamily protein [Trifolium repens]